MSINAIETAVGQRIRAALGSAPGSDSDRVQVAVDGGRVTLEGVLRRREDVRTVERAAWATWGVEVVRNHLRVEEDRRERLEEPPLPPMH